MHKVLIIIDKYGWSYDTIAKGIVEHHCNPAIAIDVLAADVDAIAIEQRHRDYDLVFPLGWTSIYSKKKGDDYQERMPYLDPARMITGVHSHRAWDDYLTQPDGGPAPPAELIARLGELRGVNFISRRLFKLFRSAGLNNGMLTENGVDTALFAPTHPINVDRQQPLSIGFSGSKDIGKHDRLKGYTQFIRPLDQLPNVVVKVLGGRGEGQVERQSMPALYNQIDLYLCASTSEGFSQSVLEAAACGRGVISTRVGGCEDLIEEGKNGFFVRRDLNEIIALVERLESDRRLVRRLGENNRRQVLDNYAWPLRVKDWLEFIERHLPRTRS